MSAEEQILRSIPYGRTEKRRAKGKKQRADGLSIGFFGFVFCLLVFLCGGLVFAAGDANKAGPPRYRVFPLRHISGEQGKEYLTQLRMGTVSLLPSPNTLLVTASAAELIKAGAVLELVDAEQQYVIKSVYAVSEGEKIPSDKEIASKVENISIGTFTELPERGPKTRVIIDVHNGELIAIAPAEELEKITAAVGRVQNKEIGVFQPTEPNESNEPNQPVQPGEPNQPTAPAQQPEPNQPSESKVKETTPIEPQEISDSNKPMQQADEQQVESGKPDELELLEESTETKTTKAEPNEGKTVAAEPNKVEAVAAVAEPNKEQVVSAEPNKPTTSAAEPQQKEPNEPSADSEKIIEQSASQPQESKNKTAAEEVQPQVPAEPQTKQEANETEEPNAAAEPTVQSRSYEPEPIPIGEEELTLDLPEKLNVIDLLDLVGKYLKLDYMYDPAKVTGEVTLKLQGPIKVRQLYPLAESVLKFRNFVMTRKGNLVTIVPSGEVLDIDPTLMYDEKGKVEYGDVIVTRLFNLQYIDTAGAKNLLGQMKLGANITDIPATGTLIVTDYAYRMGRVEELLSIIDRPGAPKQFRFRQLKYTMAQTLAPKVKTLMEQLGTISITIAQPAAPPQPTPRGRRITQQPTPAPAPPSAKPSVYLDVDERTNRILMIGFENELVVVDGLIDTLDVAQQDLRMLRIYDIQHVDAQEVRNKLQELGIISTGAAVPYGRAEAAKAAAPGAPPAAPSAVSQGLVEEPQVVIIAATNSLLVNATAEQHIQIAMIIGYVDSVTLEEAIPYEIYPLENQNPKDLAEVLQQLIQETVKDKEGKIQQVIKKQEDIEIVPDENTFSLIVYASKKNQEWIKKLIKTLDRRRPQVLIDVALVEIRRTEDFEFDLRIIANVKDLVTGNVIFGESFGLDPNVGRNVLEGGWNMLTKDSSGNSVPSGKVMGFYNESKIQTLLTAMDTKGYGRILAQPKVLVNDNEKGVISTTQKTYVQETSTVIAGEGGVSQTATKWTEYPAKIELTITPNISEGDLLRLEIAMTREDIEQRQDIKNAPPNYSTSNITTTVTVPDGSTIILGGLTKLSQSKGGSKVPLLGDIPIAGVLFRSIKNSDVTSQLYIFVKANILRPEETVGLAQLKKISDESKAGFENAERDFQTHQDIPGIEPEPMDPPRVLEAE